MGMARTARTTTPKEPGQIAQMREAASMAIKHDRKNLLWLIIAFVVPLAAGLAAAFLLSGGNWIFLILWIILALLLAVLVPLIVLARIVPRAAFEQMDGKPGAVGAVLRSGMARRWAASEMPVNVNPRTQAAVYRGVGRAGVLLIAEGPRSQTEKMVTEEKRKIARVLPNVQLNVIQVGPDEGSVRLPKLVKAMNAYKRTLSRAEVSAVTNRLSTLTQNPMDMIPKGMDPRRMRAPRPR